MPSARVLWIVAALVAAAVTGLALLPRHSAHDDVASYIEQVNATGTTFAKQYRDVTKAYATLGSAPKKESQAARLDRAARRLSQLRAQIAAVPAPKDARRLRMRLIAFYRGEESVAYEIAAITRYFPELLAAERPLAKAANAMKATVSKAASPAAQSAALTGYADALVSARARVAALDAPRVLLSARTAELARLARVERAVRSVGKALAAHDRAALNRAVKALGTPDTAAAAATRAGVVSYNRHVRDLDRLATAVEQERKRLELALR